MSQIDLTKYPPTEFRRPRASFTATLHKICRQLDAVSSHTISYEMPFLRTGKRTFDLRARGLWAVGSYARGAPTCGDLDLVFECADPNGKRVVLPVVAKTFLGARPSVRVYHGTPGDNSSGVKFEEAVLVWKPGMDWKAAIAAIQEDPQASRFARPHDVIPLRSEQVGVDVETLQEICKMHAEGVLRWTFTPLSEVIPVSASVNPSEQRFLELFGELSSMKRTLAPYVLSFAKQLAESRGIQVDIECRSSERDATLGGILIQVENLRLDVTPLDTLECTCVVLLPRLNTRGPNGFWAIERGANHPVTRAFRDVKGWTRATRDGVPVIFDSPSANGYGMVQVAEFFDSEDEAQEEANAWASVDETGQPMKDCEYLPKFLQGDDLLELLAQLDVMETLSSGTLPLTRPGELFCGSIGASRARALEVHEVIDYFHGRPPAGPDEERDDEQSRDRQ